MIKVMQIISDSNIGGAGRCVLNFLKYYDRSKFSMVVVVPTGSLLIPALKELETPYREAEYIAETSFDKRAVGVLKQIIREENPQVVHTHGNFSGRVAAKLCGKKIVYTRHSVFPVSPRISHGIGKWVNKTANEFFSDQILAVAEAAKDNLTEGGISPKKIKVILNGVEPVKEVSEAAKEQARTTYGIQKGDFAVGILARIEPYKGHQYLLEAAKIWKEQGLPVRVIIAGTGPYLEELKQMAAQLDVEDMVCFAGFVTDIQSLLSVLDVQINASYGTEATSLSLLEGMSLGLPAVVSNYGGNPGVITDGENGFLFPQKDSAALAKKVEQLMKEPQTLARLQAGAKKRFAKDFTAEIYARNIENVYLGVTERR